MGRVQRRPLPSGRVQLGYLLEAWGEARGPEGLGVSARLPPVRRKQKGRISGRQFVHCFVDLGRTQSGRGGRQGRQGGEGAKPLCTEGPHPQERRSTMLEVTDRPPPCPSPGQHRCQSPCPTPRGWSVSDPCLREPLSTHGPPRH